MGRITAASWTRRAAQISGVTLKSSSWGIFHMGKGGGLAQGYGLHWMPVNKGKEMVPGPGIAATYFVDRAFRAAEDDLRGDVDAVLKRVAEVVEFWNTTGGNVYKQKHIDKVKAAENEWGASKNLGLTPDEYRPSKDYKGMKYKNLSGPEVDDLRRILPEWAGYKDGVSTGVLERISQATRFGQKIKLKKGYTLTREVGLRGMSGHIDFQLHGPDGKLIGWWESGVSDFDRAIDLKRTFSTQTGLENIFPGGQARMAFGGPIMFLAETDIPDRMQVAIDEAYIMLVNALAQFRTNFRGYVLRTYEGAKQEYRAARGGRSRAFGGRGRPFNVLEDISVNVHYPDAPRSGLWTTDYRQFAVNVFFAHPAATSMNYGLASPRGISGLKNYRGPSWSAMGRANPDKWRFGKFGAR